MSYGTILYIGGFELPDKNAAAHRVLSIAKILKALEYRVVFIDVNRDPDTPADILSTRHTVQGFDVWSMRYPTGQAQWLRYSTRIDSMKAVMNIYEDVCLIIGYNYPAVAMQRAKKFCRRQHIRIIADCTEWYSTAGRSLVMRLTKGVDIWYRMHIVQRHLDGLIVISRYLKEYYSRKSTEPYPLVQIPPLVDLDEEKWRQPPEPLDKETRNFIYAGSPGKDKDHLSTVLEALGHSSYKGKWSLTIIGLTRDQFIGEYSHQPDLLEALGNRVQFLGRLSHWDSLRWVQSSDCTIFFRDRNRVTQAGFPTKFVESISCGTPVITNENSDLSDYILQGVNGFLITGNLTQGLDRILERQDDKLKKMKQTTDIHTFDYHLYMQDMREFLQNILSND